MRYTRIKQFLHIDELEDYNTHVHILAELMETPPYHRYEEVHEQVSDFAKDKIAAYKRLVVLREQQGSLYL